jgi:hypothetical protein
VCMCVCMYVCMYIRMYVCTYVNDPEAQLGTVGRLVANELGRTWMEAAVA